MKKVTNMVFEECMVTHEKWLKSFSWQMTLRLELSEPPCVHDQKSSGALSTGGWSMVVISHCTGPGMVGKGLEVGVRYRFVSTR